MSILNGSYYEKIVTSPKGGVYDKPVAPRIKSSANCRHRVGRIIWAPFASTADRIFLREKPENIKIKTEEIENHLHVRKNLQNKWKFTTNIMV